MVSVYPTRYTKKPKIGVEFGGKRSHLGIDEGEIGVGFLDLS